MRCLVCNSTDKWENVDQYRLVEKGMSICNGCGFVSYPKLYKTKEEILEYYRTEYRAPPSSNNIYTGTTKLHYHAHFLQEIIAKWAQDKKDNPVVTDVGAAFGMFLAWFKNMNDENGKRLFPNADISGTELTLSFRRVAWHEYGIDLREDFDDTKKYDLITSYKVAEHMLDVDKEFDRYHKALKDDGYLYLSVPTWFRILHNFGCEGFDLEYYYDTNHINVWHISHVLKIITDRGFKIVKDNHSIYDSTWLLQKRPKDEKPLEIKMIAPEEVKRCLAAVKTASDLLMDSKYKEALDVYPNFPIAWRAYYEMNKGAFHKNGFEWMKKELIDKFLSVDKESIEAYAFAADLCMRYNRYEDALEYLETGLKKRPKCPSFLTNVGNCYRAIAKKAPTRDKAEHFTREARNITKLLKEDHLQAFQKATDWIFIDHSMIPMPCEEKNAS